MNSFKDFLGKISEKKKAEGPVKILRVKKASVKDVGLWEPWLKRNEKRLKGTIEDGPPTIRLPIRKGISEALNYGHRDDLETDSRLIFHGIKQHLSDPKNFKNMTKTNKVRLNDLPIHNDLKSKYHRLSHVGITSHLPGLFGSFIRGSVSKHGGFLGLRQKKAINLHGFNSLDQDSPNHEHFKKELHDKFDVWHHEFTHHHREHIQGVDFKGGTIKQAAAGNMHGYHNHPEEVESRKRELDYHLEKQTRLHPQKYQDLKKPIEHPGSEAFNRNQKTNYYGDVMARTHHGLAFTYHSLSDENKHHFEKIIDKHMGKLKK